MNLKTQTRIFKDQTLLNDLSEFVISKGRSDVYPLVEYSLENIIVDQNFIDFLFNKTLHLTSHEIAAAIANSTNVSLYDAFKLQMHLNGNHDNDALDIFSLSTLTILETILNIAVCHHVFSQQEQ